MIAAVQSNKRPTSHVMSVAKFERFFRTSEDDGRTSF
jgi:hypothetical protein